MFSITKGEKRIISIDVSIDAPDYSISNYTYTLSKDGVVEETGTPILQEHTLYCYVEPTKIGGYVLTFEFDLGTGEHIIKSTAINVFPL